MVCSGIPMTRLAIIAALGLFVPPTFALTRHDLLGTWVGVRIVTSGGKVQRQPAAYVFRTFQTTGLLERSLIKDQAGNIFRATVKFYSDAPADGPYVGVAGSADAFSSKNGEGLALSTGDWLISHGTFSVTLTNIESDHSSSTHFRVINGKTLVLAAKSSDGVTVTGRFRRR